MFHVSLFKEWIESTVFQVPGEIELEDVDKPEYFEEEKKSYVGGGAPILDVEGGGS